MDLHHIQASATPSERAAVDALLGPPEDRWVGGDRGQQVQGHVSFGGHAVREQRHLLLPALHALQKAVGWISAGGLGYVCRRLTVPPADAYGVASFYAWFSLEPRPPMVAHVCEDLACKLAGSDGLAEELEASGDACLPSPCLGLCERAPAVLFQRVGEPDWALAPADADGVRAGLGGADAAEPPPVSASVPQIGQPGLRLLARVGVVDPSSLDDYRAHGGYAALRRAVDLGPAGVVREVTDAKLLGRGGAAFPTGVKWKAVAEAPVRPHYLICNADESEPGTFKDRVLMEADPFAVIEAMTIAGYATGAETGYLYIRAEYPLATARLEHAIAEARTRGVLGTDVMGEGIAFDVELRRGAGAYICGEETALMNSIEGYRGEPRNKPPFPTQVGLFGQPTAVNNVETLVNVLDVLGGGGSTYAETGTPDSTGTRLFCVSGALGRPGLYEVPFGTTLRELLDLAGGVPGDVQAVLLGGAAGTFLLPEQLDVRLTFEDTRAIGAGMGSGVVMVFGSQDDMGEMLLRVAAFFRDESCGQCVPCRVGTVRQEEALQRLARGRELGSRQQELALLGELAQVMRDASICGLGHTAAVAVSSALEQGLLNPQRKG